MQFATAVILLASLTSFTTAEFVGPIIKGIAKEFRTGLNPSACGEVLDSSELVVALSPSFNLPCGAKVRMQNGEREVIVPVADECADCADTDLSTTQGLFSILKGNEFSLKEVIITWQLV